MLAAKWFDMVMGVDIHVVMVPAPPSPAPIPTPLPHPFVGLIYDPGGLVVGTAIGAGIAAAMGGPIPGPVLINNLPNANTGTEGTNKMTMPHIPTPPGVAWAPIPSAPKPPVPGKPPDPPTPSPAPSNDTILITGSKTVHIGGSNQVRLGDLSMDCAEPVRLPTAAVLAVPMGPPVIVGGPPALDLLSAVLGAIRTKWMTGVLRRLTGAADGSWRSRLICMLTGHPVDVVSGMVITDATDFELPGPIPFTFERTYYSKASAWKGALGHGWRHTYDESVLIARDRIVHVAGDGRELYFDLVEPGGATRNESEKLDLVRSAHEIRIQKDNLLTHVFAPVGRADGSWPLVAIEDPRGNRISFRYDERGNLSGATDSAGRHVEFVNDEAGRITTIKLPHPDDRSRQFDVVRFAYDEAGDLVEAYDALGHPLRYAYKHHLLVQETMRNGLSFYWAYDGITPDAKCVRTWGDGGIFDHVLTYDTASNITIKEDSYGSCTLYYANDAGLVDKIVDSLGRERTFEYDDSLRTVEEVDPLGGTLTMAYDARGNISGIKDGDGVSREYEYDRRDQPVREVIGGAFEYLHTYNEFGELVESTDPAGRSVRQAFHDNGDLRWVESKEGRRLTFAWDGDRNPTQAVFPGGIALGAIYDALGRSTQATFPDGESVRFVLDLNGRPVEVTRPGGRVDRFEYDPSGLALRELKAGGAEVRYEYGNFNKVTAIHDERGTQRFEYDKEGSLIRVINQKGERWEIIRNSEGEAIKETDFAGRPTEYRLDDAGRVVEQIDAEGAVCRKEWTPGGRLAAVEYADGCFEKYTYNERGLIATAENESGTLVLEYDEAGRRIKETWNDWSIETAYDGDDLRTALRTSDGLDVRYQHDEAERLTSIDVNGKAQQWRYDARGRPMGVQLPGGSRQEFEYADDGLAEIHRVTGPQGERIAFRKLERTSGGDVAAVADAARGLRSYASGPHGLEAVFQDGVPIERFQHDSAGELLPFEGPGRVGPGGRLEEFGGVSYEYDLNGRVVRRIEDGRAQRLSYNGRGQLVESEDPDGHLTRYEYDPLGRRVAKRNGSRTTEWRWDGRSPLREERAENGRVEARDWIHSLGTYVPLMVVRDGRCYSVVTDHVGTPQEVGFDNPIRLPGQWYDEETGLHYNQNRYYDPKTARYLTPDPVGLHGGTSSYAYPADPINYADPEGLGCVRRFFSSYLVFLRSGIRPKHARALMRLAQETGMTFAFRNIGGNKGFFGRMGRRFGSLFRQFTGMRPKPLSVKGKSNFWGVAEDANGNRFRSDYDPAYYRGESGQVLDNTQADAVNRAVVNPELGGNEIQHSTHNTMNEVLPPEKVAEIGPPGNSTEFRPDGSTRQVTNEDMANEMPDNWFW
jgi:RHS repeat-associated protein